MLPSAIPPLVLAVLFIARFAPEQAQSIRNWAALCFEVELP